MEVVIILAIIIVMALMFYTVKVSKRWSVVFFIVVYIVANALIINMWGITEHTGENILFTGFAFLVIWLRINKSFADTASAREQLKDRLSQGKYSTFEVCGSKKITYHRTPKNIGQLLLGGLTCENCGAEIDVPLDVFMPKLK
jgi:hypothetical protein